MFFNIYVGGYGGIVFFIFYFSIVNRSLTF